MAKKSVEGQLDLFELFSSVEELEESVKGVPELEDGLDGEAELEEEAKQEEEAESEEEPMAAVSSEPSRISGEQRQPEGTPVMQRSFRNTETDASTVIAYLTYNMVYLKDWQSEPVIYEFDSSKDAVDFYVGQMERLSGDKKVKAQKEQCPLEKAVRKKWTGEVEI